MAFVAVAVGAALVGAFGHVDDRGRPIEVLAVELIDRDPRDDASAPAPPDPPQARDEGHGLGEPSVPPRLLSPHGRVRPIGWYRLAAAEYGLSPQLLEALHEVESSGAPDGCVKNRRGSGATGPFQFKPATFREFGVDGNHDGVADICGFADSAFSAARYLRRLGADADPSSAESRRALARYGTDVDRVVRLARAYHDQDGPE